MYRSVKLCAVHIRIQGLGVQDMKIGKDFESRCRLTNDAAAIEVSELQGDLDSALRSGEKMDCRRATARASSDQLKERRRRFTWRGYERW